MITRILLDTCPVRDYLEGTNVPFDIPTIRQRCWKYRISMADSTMAELMEQLLSGDLSFADWTARIGAIDQILDPHWPIFPGGQELTALPKSYIELTDELKGAQVYYQESWQLMRQATCIGDLQRGREYFSRGRRFRIHADAAHVNATMAAERRTWIDFIDKMKKLKAKAPDIFKSVDTIAKFMKDELGNAPGESAEMRHRYDAILRVQAQFIHMALSGSNPYNPGSVKRRGDLFDMAHLYALPLPAVVVTADEKFLRRLQETKAPDARQILLVAEFNARAGNDTLEQVLSHRQAADDELRSWRERAYLRWHNRGKPDGDDWNDWFAAEPIA